MTISRYLLIINLLLIIKIVIIRKKKVSSEEVFEVHSNLSNQLVEEDIIRQ